MSSFWRHVALVPHFVYPRLTVTADSGDSDSDAPPSAAQQRHDHEGRRGRRRGGDLLDRAGRSGSSCSRRSDPALGSFVALQRHARSRLEAGPPRAPSSCRGVVVVVVVAVAAAVSLSSFYSRAASVPRRRLPLLLLCRGGTRRGQGRGGRPQPTRPPLGGRRVPPEQPARGKTNAPLLLGALLLFAAAAAARGAGAGAGALRSRATHPRRQGDNEGGAARRRRVRGRRCAPGAAPSPTGWPLSPPPSGGGGAGGAGGPAEGCRSVGTTGGDAKVPGAGRPPLLLGSPLVPRGRDPFLRFSPHLCLLVGSFGARRGPRGQTQKKAGEGGLVRAAVRRH
jgi:hypothetical protein